MMMMKMGIEKDYRTDYKDWYADDNDDINYDDWYCNDSDDNDDKEWWW